jgi:hypothetical protein
MADLALRSRDEVGMLTWCRRAYDVLWGMKQKGLFLSPEDEGRLEQLAQLLGL